MPSQATPSFLVHVATNVRQARKRAGVSQRTLAEASGISLRMIGAIENGTTSLSTATLDRIAVALDTTLSELVADSSGRRSVVRNQLGWEGEKGGEGILRWSVDARREAETWEWVLQPGERYEAGADPEGWHVMLFVVSGVLTLTCAGKKVELTQTGHLFASDQVHVFENRGRDVMRFFRCTVW
ncbi:MAG TPA: helix-turn-helix domain-containing protein [Luteibacter sp.]